VINAVVEGKLNPCQTKDQIKDQDLFSISTAM